MSDVGAWVCGKQLERGGLTQKDLRVERDLLRVQLHSEVLCVFRARASGASLGHGVIEPRAASVREATNFSHWHLPEALPGNYAWRGNLKRDGGQAFILPFPRPRECEQHLHAAPRKDLRPWPPPSRKPTHMLMPIASAWGKQDEAGEEGLPRRFTAPITQLACRLYPVRKSPQLPSG
jgi:hypothetical protein